MSKCIDAEVPIICNRYINIYYIINNICITLLKLKCIIIIDF